MSDSKLTFLCHVCGEPARAFSLGNERTRPDGSLYFIRPQPGQPLVGFCLADWPALRALGDQYESA